MNLHQAYHKKLENNVKIHVLLNVENRSVKKKKKRVIESRESRFCTRQHVILSEYLHHCLNRYIV